MRFLILSLLGPAACSASSCPYAGRELHTRDVEPDLLSYRDAVPNKKGAMLMNRINPSTSQLYIANADGSNKRLLLGNNSVYKYHASFSPDGQYVAFTTERNGDSNSDLYMVHVDGSGLQPIATTPSAEDAVAISPDGKSAVYASTTGLWTSNIWLTDLTTGSTRNLTNQTGVTGNPKSPSGFFAPSWSPDGKWIVFSSDRESGWTGHDEGTGWEHTQNLSIYTISPDGTGFREVYNNPAMSSGSPKFSPDGSRVVFYEMTLQNTWDARSSFTVGTMTNQIISVDFATGTDRVQHTNSSRCKIYPQFIAQDNIGYLLKGGSYEGVYQTSGAAPILGGMRSPAWSPDSKLVVYEKTDWTTRPLEKKLWSWDTDWEYRFMDVFPVLSLQGQLALTLKQTGSPGNSSIISIHPNGTYWTLVFDSASTGQLSPGDLASGGAGAFQPSWSSDGQWLTFGLGDWFQSRYSAPAWIYRARADGSYYEQLTTNATNRNAGFPSFSPDGTKIVFRDFLPDFGLRVLDLATNQTTVLTTERDNLPQFSPDGEWVTRNVTNSEQFSNYEVAIIRSDGTDLTMLTSSYANDAHAV